MIYASQEHGPHCDEAREEGDLWELCPDCFAILRESDLEDEREDR